MKVKWTMLGMVVFFLLSVAMTCCFIWQYRMPKLKPEVVVKKATVEDMCPRFPEPVPLKHPITSLRVALEKTDVLLRSSIHTIKLPAISAIVVLNDSVLWNGNFGKKNISNPSSSAPNEYTVYRIASLSKIFPTLMLYKLWEDGLVHSLDDPLEKYTDNFTIKNPLGKSGGAAPSSVRTLSTRTPALSLRRMASQLSGLPRRLRSTNLLWSGDTQAALRLLQDDVLVANPGTKCHYSNVAFSLLANILAQKVTGSDYESWVSDNILERLSMEDTGFNLTPAIQRQMAVGVYSNGQPAPLYNLGWYRPAGQMYSTAADMAKLMMALLGAYGGTLLRQDTLNTMLTPVSRCHSGYFSNSTGTPWEINEQFGYDVVRKDGDLDGYAATLSLVPQLKLGLVVLMAGVRPANQDLVSQAFSYLIPAVESAFRDAHRTLRPPPDPTPYIGFFTYRNMTFYEIKVDSDGVLIMQQFGPQVDTTVLSKYRSIRLDYLQDRVFRVVFESPYPCKLKVNSASVSLEAQDRQLFNFYLLNKKGVSPGFDSPGLNTYRVTRIAGRPYFNS
ncbi:putative beta-lactamase-like 1 isoform X1 [Seriola lalandi dorsalis]|uniref:Lactamase, beta-like 1a n=2 Tax=Seriola lalandi dorsalis TaxID=1841481 RepID=A0A3B4YP98_SERLL|nr:putative beta-lactamase-like 1 isoform X1 [Seriola lalandi dorsalis]XP_023283149.1 putative beta-lactamase-like 1 isoform X1 [Seriola lalandi dorsalis]XP_056241806.1 putative beta-lactamase-like 1 [Seriola aureovittata]